MLILYLGSEYQAITPMLGTYDINNTKPIVVAQQGVYQLHNILSVLSERNDTVIYVIKRDLLGSGLLSTFVGNDRINIIEYEEFVRLTVQHVPCITLQ